MKQQFWIEESGQWLENVDRTHQVLASGKPVQQKDPLNGQNGHLVDRGKREVVGRGQVSTVARDVHLASAPQLLQHRLERRVQQTRVEAVPRKQQTEHVSKPSQSILFVAFLCDGALKESGKVAV